jgi:tripartite-type tricarboxylate transporter receptor subunit TctC
MKTARWLVLLLTLTLFAGLSGAQGGRYPDRPVKLVVGFPAGQATDIVARLLADRLSQSMGQPFVVENRPGQGGSLGLAHLAKSPPDGYTMVLAATASLVTNPHLYKSVGYDPLTDFAPSGVAMEIPLALVAHPSAPFNTLAELVAYAKANPGKLNYSSVGNGTLSHLAMERLKREAGITMMHIPYQGSVRSIADLVAGNVMLSFDTLTVTVPHIESKRLKLIAVASGKRVPQLPDAPTLIEAGMPGFVASPWLGVLFPKGTPAEIVMAMNAEIRKALDDPGMQKSMLTIGAVARPNSPEEFARLLQEDHAKWGRIVRESGARVD